MNEKISDVFTTILATIYTGFGGFIFVKDLLIVEGEDENEDENEDEDE